jgi:hypothetical protein
MTKQTRRKNRVGIQILGSVDCSVSNLGDRSPQDGVKKKQIVFISQAVRASAASVEARAVEVLGSKRIARSWMRTPQRALAEIVPLEMLGTTEGIKEVLAVLGAIEDGGYL